MAAASEVQHLREDEGGIRAGDLDRPLRLEQLQRLGRRVCFLGILASLTVLAAWARLGPFLLTDHALDQAIADSIGADRLYEAERLLEHASYFHVLAPDRIQEHRQAIEGRNSVGARLWRTARGFVRGDGHSTEELVGSVVSDLTLFGDVRDLGIEGWHALSGQEVDGLRAALSGVGAALTLLPEVKAGASCIKASMKCVSKRLAAEVVELATVAVKERNLTRLEPILVAVGKAGKVDALAVPAIVKVADTTDEVVTLSRDDAVPDVGDRASQDRARGLEAGGRIVILSPRSLAVVALLASSPLGWTASPIPMSPLNPTDPFFVLAHLRTPPRLALHKGEYADAVVRAHRIVQAFAREHGWARQAAVRTFDSVEIFADQAALWRRILELNHLPPGQPLPTKGLAAGIEGRVLVALDPRGYARIAPEYSQQADGWARLLAHEMVHRLHVVILDGNEEAMGPQWFFEGFAVLGAGQRIDEGLVYRSAREALAGVTDTKSPLLYRRFVAAVRYFSGRVPLVELVKKAGSKDFESWLAGR